MEEEEESNIDSTSISTSVIDHNADGSSQHVRNDSVNIQSPPSLKNQMNGTNGQHLNAFDISGLNLQPQPSDERHQYTKMSMTSLAGYDTAAQTPTSRMGGDSIASSNVVVSDKTNGGMDSLVVEVDRDSSNLSHNYANSFISSSTDSNSHSQTPTVAMAYSGSPKPDDPRNRLPTSPEECEVNHPLNGSGSGNGSHDGETDNFKPQRGRVDSEEVYNTMRNANLPNHVPKFYESDVDSVNDSLIYSGRNPGLGGGGGGNLGLKRDSKDRFPSLTSVPSDDIDDNNTFIRTSSSNEREASLTTTSSASQHSQHQQQKQQQQHQHGSYHELSTPQKSRSSSSSTNHDNMTTSTPNISNLTKHRVRGGSGSGSGNGSGGASGSTGTNDNDATAARRVLPYQKRKQLNQQQESRKNRYGGYSRGGGGGGGGGDASNYDHDHDPYSRGYEHGQGQGHGHGYGNQNRYGYEGHGQQQYQHQQNPQQSIRPQRELSTISTPVPSRSPTHTNLYHPNNNIGHGYGQGQGHGHGYEHGHGHGQHNNYNQLPPSGQGHLHQQPHISNRHHQGSNNYGNNDNDYHGGNGGGGGGGRHPPRHPKNPKKGHSNHGGDGQGQNYHNNPPPSHHPPVMHVRNESSGSVSSLGSAMGGASMAMKDGRRLTEHLGREIEAYRHESSSLAGNSKGRNESSVEHSQERNSEGFLNSFLGSINFTSEGSFSSMRSVEDERADYRKKGKNIIKKAERVRKRQQKGGGLLPGLGDRGRR